MFMVDYTVDFGQYLSIVLVTGDTFHTKTTHQLLTYRVCMLFLCGLCYY